AARAITTVTIGRMGPGLSAVAGSFKFRSRLQGDVLGPDPVRRAPRQPTPGGLGVLQRFARPARHDLLLGAGQPGARDVALRAVDHAELVPGGRVLAVSADRP